MAAVKVIGVDAEVAEPPVLVYVLPHPASTNESSSRLVLIHFDRFVVVDVRP